MMLFGKDFVRSLALGFVLGSAAMAIAVGSDTARAAPVTSPVAVIGS
jgi:hypothetical protein